MGRPRKKKDYVKMYVATDSGVTDIDGIPFRYARDHTRVPEDHPVLKQAPHSFKRADAPYLPEVETATAAPGERRGDDAE